MTRVYDDVMTIAEYMDHIGINEDNCKDIDQYTVETLDELRGIINRVATENNENKYGTIWDYPLNEIDHIIQDTDLYVVLVVGTDKSGFIPSTEYRWFEIPQ